jgi:hypothetical protein
MLKRVPWKFVVPALLVGGVLVIVAGAPAGSLRPLSDIGGNFLLFCM